MRSDWYIFIFIMIALNSAQKSCVVLVREGEKNNHIYSRSKLIVCVFSLLISWGCVHLYYTLWEFFFKPNRFSFAFRCTWFLLENWLWKNFIWRIGLKSYICSFVYSGIYIYINTVYSSRYICDGRNCLWFSYIS